MRDGVKFTAQTNEPGSKLLKWVINTKSKKANKKQIKLNEMKRSNNDTDVAAFILRLTKQSVYDNFIKSEWVK